MKLEVVAAVNQRDVLDQNLRASPLIAEQDVPLHIEEGHTSCSAAYNAGMAHVAADTDAIVFAHQDVYIPRGWEHRLEDAVQEIEAAGASWSVLGVYGVQASGQHVGTVWSTGLQREVDQGKEAPKPVVSVDELLIVVKRDSGLEFDPTLPGFHMYGTDIVQTALEAGHGAFVFQGPVIHNSTPVRRLDDTYWNAHRHLQRKWKNRLPIPTCVVDLPVSRAFRMRLAIRSFKNNMRNSAPRERLADPAAKARELGYEQALTPNCS